MALALGLLLQFHILRKLNMTKLLFIVLFLISTLAHAQSTVTIEAYGDSTTAAEAWVLQGRYCVKTTVISKGVSGTTYRDLIAGANGQTKFADAMSTSNADIVMVNFGINDAFQGISSIEWYLGEVKRITTFYNKTLIIQTSNPINNSYFQANSDMANRIRVWAQANGVWLSDNYNNVLNYPNWQTLLCPDNVHPNSTGYEFKGYKTFQVVDPLVTWYLTHITNKP
jgi:lysophospholipase L1-like esterase